MDGVWKSLLTFCPRRRLKLHDKQLNTASSDAAVQPHLFSCLQSQNVTSNLRHPSGQIHPSLEAGRFPPRPRPRRRHCRRSLETAGNEFQENSPGSGGVDASSQPVNKALKQTWRVASRRFNYR